jgi:hypothetical protein
MRSTAKLGWVFCAVFMSAWPDDAPARDVSGLSARLGQTRALNSKEIIDAQFEHAETMSGFRVGDPYTQSAQTAVRQWHDSEQRDAGVCAIRFADVRRFEYTLRDFDSTAAAASSGYQVTHQGRCGSCSTLADLAVYLATPDLTTPARACARKLGAGRIKQCYVERIGFSEYCAESWTYNSRNTRSNCLGACIAEYGLLNLVLGRYPSANTDESGRLNACLLCDEQNSGPGFKYSAGRTRRNSGIESAILRPDSEIFHLDHFRYFQEPDASLVNETGR